MQDGVTGQGVGGGRRCRRRGRGRRRLCGWRGLAGCRIVSGFTGADRRKLYVAPPVTNVKASPCMSTVKLKFAIGGKYSSQMVGFLVRLEREPLLAQANLAAVGRTGGRESDRQIIALVAA